MGCQGQAGWVRKFYFGRYEEEKLTFYRKIIIEFYYV